MIPYIKGKVLKMKNNGIGIHWFIAILLTISLVFIVSSGICISIYSSKSKSELEATANKTLSNVAIYDLVKKCYIDNYKSCSNLNNKYVSYQLVTHGLDSIMKNGLNCIVLNQKAHKMNYSETLVNFMLIKVDQDTCVLQQAEIQKLAK